MWKIIAATLLLFLFNCPFVFAEGASKDDKKTIEISQKKAKKGTEKAVEKTGKALEKAAEKTSKGLKKAGEATGKALEKAGKKIKEHISIEKDEDKK